MIVAVTSYDDATASNQAVCSILQNASHPQLFGNQVTRELLLNILRDNPRRETFFACHGQQEALIGHNGSTLITVADAITFSDRVNFAIACHTGDLLGAQVSKLGGLWCGYVGAINCLPSDADLISHFQRIPLFIRDRLHTINDAISANNFVAEFEILLEEITEAVEGLGTMEPLLALMHYKTRLRIWIPGTADPVKSASATAPSLF